MSENKDDAYLKQVFVTQTKGFKDVTTKHEIWQEVANEFDAELKVSHTTDNVFKIFRINIPYNNLEIKLSESDTQPLKFEISFTSILDFELIIGIEDSIDRLLKKLGKKELELGNEEFDKKYLINSHNPEITKKLITQDIIEGFIKSEVYSFAYTSDIKKQTSNLLSVISRTIEDKDKITDLIRLHMKIIDNLKGLKIVE